MTGYAWHVGTLRDGLLSAQIPLVSTSWSLVMDDAGTMSGSMPLADSSVAALNPYLIAEPCRCFLALAYTDDDGTETFLEGGPIWTHAYDSTSRLLTVGAAGVWSYYDHRRVLPVLAAGVNPATITTAFTSSLGTIAKQLVQLAHTHTAGSLPIVLPGDEAGSNVRTYQGYEMNVTGQALRDLTGVIGGPEIQFVPRRRADDSRYIEWVMRVGTTEVPTLQQAGADWSWDASAVKSSVGGITVQRDGTGMATRWWMQGGGTDKSTMFSEATSATLTNAGFPLLEQTDSTHSTVTVQATLDGYAAGALLESQGPTETWTLKVQRDEVPLAGTYRPGDWVSVTIGDKEPYLPTGIYRTRITQISGDDSTSVTVQLSPTIGAV